MSAARPATVALCAGAALLISACGAVKSVTGDKTTPSPTPSANGVADKPAAEILQQAKRAFEQATSVHVKGHGTTEGALYVVDVRIKGSKGGKGTVTAEHNTIDLLRIAEDAYIKGDADFWKAVTGDATAAELLKGKYLKAPSSDPRLRSILLFTDANFFADAIFKAEGTMTKGDRRTIEGVETIGVNVRSAKGGGSTIYVATTGRPYPIQLATSGQTADAGTLDFLDYDKPLTLSPPPADLVVDTSKIGN